MSKRRLTRRQSWRIARRQQERSERAERGELAGEALLEGSELGPELPAQVVTRFGSQVDVMDRQGKQHRCHLRANLGSIVAGDHVVFRAAEGGNVVVAREPRSTELQRPDKFGALRTIAANIDRVIIVIAALPTPYGNLIDRYLVATENLGAEAVILLNKADLLKDTKLAASIDATLEPYAPLGYVVRRAAGKSGAIEELRALLDQRTSILVGQSGVGKTTLLNALLPEAGQRVGALSEDRQKGKHTTTSATLFPLPGGGAIIDSPGIREFGLWHLSREEVERGFREFRDRVGQCRFRDCAHEGEPGCALECAIADGAIHPARLASYRHIVGSLEIPLEP